MFKVLCLFIAVLAVFALVDLREGEVRAAQIGAQAQRSESQDAVLTTLQAMNDPAVSEFATDWRKSYPNPSPAELAELRDIEQRIKNDRTAAVKMTRSYKMKNNPICSGQVSAVFSSSAPDCPPGL